MVVLEIVEESVVFKGTLPKGLDGIVDELMQDDLEFVFIAVEDAFFLLVAL